MNYYIDLSNRLLETARSGESTQSIRHELYYVTETMLVSRLNTDELKIIFWENIYSAYLLIMLKEQVQPQSILKRKRIKVVRLVLSLNDITYGILRKPQYKIGLFRFYSSFYYSFVKDIAVEKAAVSNVVRLDKDILLLSESL